MRRGAAEVFGREVWKTWLGLGSGLGFGFGFGLGNRVRVRVRFRDRDVVDGDVAPPAGPTLALEGYGGGLRGRVRVSVEVGWRRVGIRMWVHVWAGIQV